MSDLQSVQACLPSWSYSTPEALTHGKFTAYHALGWCPIPLRPQSKHPALASWLEYQGKRPSEEDRTVWDAGNYNVGIVTGTISGIFVLDIDGPAGEAFLQEYELQYGPLPETVCVQTTKGRHLYFRYPADAEIRNLSKKAVDGTPMPDIDVRGNGGYVVVPPSIHPDPPHHAYAWQLSPWDQVIADAPSWLLALVSKPKPAALDFGDAASQGKGEAYLRAALQDELATLMQAANGSRNDQLNKSAFALGQLVAQGLDEQEVRSKLEAVAFALGLDQNETKRTIDSGINSGKANPRTDKTDTTMVSSVLSVGEPGLSDKNAWPDPQPVKQELLPVPPLDPAMIPEPLRAWAVDVSERMQCPIDYVVASSIVTIGGLIGARCSIRPKRQDNNWFIVPNLWGAIIGRPSTLKSPVLSETLRPIRKLEMESKEAYEKAQQEFKLEAHVAKAKEEQVLKEIADHAKGKNGAKSLEELQREYSSLEFPKEPKWKRYHTNDATVEKLSDLLSVNPHGMLVFRDELIGLLKAWEKEGHAGDRAFFLESWNGFGSHITDRIGRGTIFTENVCLSILGSTQPGRLSTYLHQGMKEIGNDGLIQRFQLLVMPDERKHWQLVDRKGNMFAKDRVDAIFNALAALNFLEHGATVADDKRPPFYRFADDAQELFYEWLIRLEIEKLRGAEDGLLLEHLTKYRKLMPALALIFHIIRIADDTGSGPVSSEATALAIAWCDYLEQHAKRIYHMATDMTHQAAAALAQKIGKGELEDNFTIRALYRKGWQGLNEQELAEAACDELVRLGWLAERQRHAATKGGRNTTTYLINPKLKGQAHEKANTRQPGTDNTAKT
jgi:putative DNA primase/helicase